ncbi:esterase-like activity of phytase family protein [Rhizorhabdus argentea]|uniref:esterase-like activity of phytase family protein n=1 Tax=Rhizorhabdus argentea TaxID=1387174 RepID=UPI0030ED2D3F
MKKVLAALLFCLLPSSAGYPQASDVAIVATPIAIDPDDPAHRDIGRLRYLAGWRLTSRQRNFGGYSSLRVDGDRFIALADTGDYMRFRMAEPGTITESRFGTLPAFPTNTGTRADRDSESMTEGPQGDIWVGFEARNAILRYSADFGKPLAWSFPAAMKGWSFNSGAEAMVRLDDGRFVIFCEGTAVAPSVHAALLFPGDPTDPKNVPIQFGYRPPRDYAPTDARQLPDGRIIVLQRRFGVLSGFAAAVSIVDPRAISEGAAVDGELIAEIKPPLNVDNMEGISVAREGDKLIIWMISDDNQIALQRTLLLKFELLEPAR